MTLIEALRQQAVYCTKLGSPFTGQVLEILSEVLHPGTKLTDRLFAWEGDIGPYGASLPLRLAGGLHGLVLAKKSAPLAAAYPPHPTDRKQLKSAIEDALNTHSADLDRWLDRPPQTNEVRRAAALIYAGRLLTAKFGLPLALSELGASAGLNLFWDHFGLQIGGAVFRPDRPAFTLAPGWSGPLPPQQHSEIIDRSGVDLSPIDPTKPEGRLRLLSYIWPDQTDRLARTEAAIGIARPVVDKGDAADWLEAKLADSHPGATHLIYHTIAWQYFPDDVQARCRKAIEAAGERAREDAPLAWLGVEADETPDGAGMTLRLWPRNTTHDLGRMDFHGRWLKARLGAL